MSMFGITLSLTTIILEDFRKQKLFRRCGVSVFASRELTLSHPCVDPEVDGSSQPRRYQELDIDPGEFHPSQYCVRALERILNELDARLPIDIDGQQSELTPPPVYWRPLNRPELIEQFRE